MHIAPRKIAHDVFFCLRTAKRKVAVCNWVWLGSLNDRGAGG